MPTTRTLSFTTTHRMIYRVHGNTANMGTISLPSGPAGFPELLTFVLTITHLTYTGSAVVVKFSYFTGWQSNQNIPTFLGHQLSSSTGTPYHLSAFTYFHFYIVNNRTERDINQRQTITWLNIGGISGHDGVTNRDTVG
jgi:hypothetical protein